MGKSYYDDMLDIALKYAGHEILKEEASFRTAGEENFSEGFEKRMKRLIGSEKRKQSAPKILRVTTRVAAALLILIVISTAVIFSSEALRVKVMNMFYNIGSSSADVEFYDVGDSNIPEGMVMPGYMPEGYRFSKATKNNWLYISEYKDPDGNIIKIFQEPEGSNKIVDSDGIAAYATEIKGRQAFVSLNEEKNYLIFNYDTHDFVVIGKVDISELTKIAESIIK